MTLRNHKDLDVWQLSRRAVKSVYDLTEGFPAKEQYGLVSQIRRAAVSIPANLAEGNARSTREYAYFVNVARGSASELDTLLQLADDLGYLKDEAYEEQAGSLLVISKMLNRLSQSLKKTNP